MERGSSSLSSVQRPDTPWMYAVKLSGDKLSISKAYRSEEEAEADIGRSEDPDNPFSGVAGVDYKFLWSRYHHLTSTSRMIKELTKEGIESDG